MRVDTGRIQAYVREWAMCKAAIQRVTLFGSRARNDHRTDSDVDLAVLVAGNAIEDEDTIYVSDVADWEKELSQCLKHRVNIVQQCSGGNSRLQETILCDGIVLYDASDVQHANR